MSKFVFLLLVVSAAAFQTVQAQELAQTMEMPQGGSEAKPDAMKASGMSCCCAKKADTAKKAEPAAQAKP
ncbi:hypothetical protein [Candidatus Cyanaurora vandensis]|uniref:hypothetical protein n=1 Tax=Candidatus Cyanaurora vandensis TaxID=2714958 RepID=UPI00257B3260|nr:hypothetical protein [Candidatus Cyanaurora vandensis]